MRNTWKLVWAGSLALILSLSSVVPSSGNALVVVFPQNTHGFLASADNTGFQSVATVTNVTPSITGGTNGANINVVVSATNSGLLRLTSTANIQAASGFNLANFQSGSNGLSTISFKGLVADVNTAIASLQFRKQNNGTSSISIDVSEGSGLVYDNRLYEVVTGTISWENAFKAALAKSVPASGGGPACQGYLVTITSQGEQDFVYDKVKNPTWIGLSDADLSISGSVDGGADVFAISSTGHGLLTGDSVILSSSITSDTGADFASGATVTVTRVNDDTFTIPSTGTTAGSSISVGGGAASTNSVSGFSAKVSYVDAALIAFNSDRNPITTNATSGEGKYFWISGPERGQQVTVGNRTGNNVQNPFTINGVYSNFATGEPNDSGSDEDAIQFIDNGTWNDLPVTSTLGSYVVEYGGLRVDQSPQSYSFRNLTHIGTRSACTPAAAAGAITRTFTAEVAAVPGAPTGVTATAGAQSATVSWTAPASNGGSAITGYKIEIASGGSYSTAVANTGSTSTTATISNLLVGTSYTFKVSAINVIGTSVASSASTGVTPTANLPGAPGNITVTYPGGSAPVQISWEAPSNNGGSAITSYVVEYQTGSTWVPLTASGLTATVAADLVSINSTWQVRVAAVNVAGQGAWTTWQNKPPAPYSGPVFTGFSAREIVAGRNASLTLEGSNLSMISELSIDGTKLTFTRDGDKLVAAIPGLKPGTYDLRVVFTGGGVLTHQSALVVRETSASEARVNVGSFNGRVVLYVAGSPGSTVTWKIGGRWGRAVATSDFVRIDRPTARRGVTVNVEVFVDGVKTLSRSLVTR